jgi:tetratricopeptide (TPR) repeat protein
MLSSDLNNLAFVYLEMGAFEQSRQYRARAVELAERLGDQGLVVMHLMTLSFVWIATGEWSQARRDLERAVQLGRQLSEPSAAAHPLYILGRLSLSEGKWEEAARHLDEARARGWEGAQYALAERELLAGRPEAARALLLPVPDPVPVPEGYPFQLLAWADVERGHESEAEALIEERIRRTTILHEEDRWLDPHLIEALLRACQQRWEEAEALMEGALATCRARSDGESEAIALYFYGRLHQEHGEPELARQRWEAALVILHRLGERLYAEQIEQLLVSLER